MREKRKENVNATLGFAEGDHPAGLKPLRQVPKSIRVGGSEFEEFKLKDEIFLKRNIYFPGSERKSFKKNEWY